MIDVSAEIEIAASPAAIAGVMFDPQRNHEWMKGIEKVEMLDPALAPGARVRHHGEVMGKKLSVLTTVETVHFPHVLALTISEGPFVGVARIGIQRSGSGSRVQVHSTGEVKGMPFIPDSMIAGPIKTALEGGLARLKALIEAPVV
jgi:carbon monoxide dehydrogenase subunit G